MSNLNWGGVPVDNMEGSADDKINQDLLDKFSEDKPWLCPDESGLMVVCTVSEYNDFEQSWSFIQAGVNVEKLVPDFIETFISDRNENKKQTIDSLKRIISMIEKA